MLVLLSTGINVSLGGLIYSFPHHLINLIFVVVTLIGYPLLIFKNKKLKYIGLGISIVLLLFYGSMPFIKEPVYETTIRCSKEDFYYDDTYKIYSTEDLGDLSFEYLDSIESYCIHAKFRKTGETKITVESPTGEKREFDITVGKNTYDIKE